MKEIAAGGIIVKDGRVVIVAQGKHSHSLPKGHIQEGEEILEGAYREIYEETGLLQEEIKLIKPLGSFIRPDGRSKNDKEIHIFLFTTDKEELKPIDPDNPKAFWAEIDKAHSFLPFRQDREFFLSVKDELDS